MDELVGNLQHELEQDNPSSKVTSQSENRKENSDKGNGSDGCGVSMFIENVEAAMEQYLNVAVEEWNFIAIA